MGLKTRHWFGVLAMAMVAALLPSSAAASGPTITPVTSGLDSPRGIAFFHGKLMVGEAGHGGSDCFSPEGAPPGVQLCIGATSRVSQVNSNGTHTPFVTGLFSVATPEGESLGVSGLSASEDSLLVQIGFTPREAPNNAFAQQQAGQLISVRSNGTWKAIASVGAFGFDWTVKLNSPTQEFDSNPYGVLATEDGALVTDAGANTLDLVHEDGKIKVLAFDPWLANPPTFPHDAVPTCVVRGNDGLLVGELSGRLLKVHGTTFTTVQVNDSAGHSLLSHVTGCTTDRHGNVYFVNMFGPGPVFTPPPASKFFIGNVVKYNPETGKASMLVDGLRFPNMATVGPDGNLYVTIGSVCGPTPGPANSPCAGLTGGVIKIALSNGENDD